MTCILNKIKLKILILTSPAYKKEIFYDISVLQKNNFIVLVAIII